MRFWQLFSIVILFGILFNLAAVNVQAGTVWESQVGMGGDGAGSGVMNVFTDDSEDADVRGTLVSVIKYFLGFLALIFIIIIIWSGFKWMKAGGNEDNVRDAKRSLLAAIIGIVLILSAYAITEFVTELTFEAIEGGL